MAIPAELKNGDGTVARAKMGKDQYLQFRETDRPQPDYDGHHVQMYITNFSGPYRRLLDRSLVSQEDNPYQYRFRDIVDLTDGRHLFTVEHEVRSATHPMYLRPLVNRNPASTNQNLRARSRPMGLGDGTGPVRRTMRQDAAVATRTVRYPARYLLPEFRLLQSAAAENLSKPAAMPWAARATLDTRRRFCRPPARPRAHRRRPADQRRCRRHRADPLDQLRRGDGGQTPDDSAWRARARAGKRSLLAGAGMAGARGGARALRSRRSASPAMATGPRRFWPASNGPARLRSRWPRSRRCTGPTAA